MVANPEITNVIATQSASTIKCLIAIKNSAITNGMVRIAVTEDLSGLCNGEIYAIFNRCIESNVSTYVIELNSLLQITATPTSIPLSVCVRTFQCVAGEDCVNGLCTTYDTTAPYWIKNNISLSTGLGIVPNRITDGLSHVYDKSLIFTWIPPTNTLVTYYSIGLYDGVTLLQSGYTKYNPTTGLIVSGLTNGVTYRLAVSAISDDGLTSTQFSIFGRPNIACTNLICDFNVS